MVMHTPQRTTRPKKKELEAWSDLELERLAAQRVARRCAKEQAEIAKGFEAFYCQEQKKGGPMVLFGFVLQFVAKRSPVKWRDKMLELAGADVVKEAEESAGEVLRFTVTAPTG